MLSSKQRNTRKNAINYNVAKNRAFLKLEDIQFKNCNKYLKNA